MSLKEFKTNYFVVTSVRCHSFLYRFLINKTETKTDVSNLAGEAGQDFLFRDILRRKWLRPYIQTCRAGLHQHHSSSNYLPKVGIRNFSPHLRNSAILRTGKSIAELRTKKSCGTAIANLQNLTSAILQLSAISGQIPYFIVPFTRLRML